MWQTLLKWHFLLRGWKLGNNLPAHVRKCVIVVAPHTSAWDFIYGAGAKVLFGLDAVYLAKKELFRWPIRKLLTSLGGIPVDRSRSQGVTATIIEYLRNHDPARVVFPPEGTRQPTRKWKTGFYFAALGAGVPIALAYLDFKRKEAGFGPVFMPCGDRRKDFLTIRNFYKDIAACRPDRFLLPDVE